MTTTVYPLETESLKKGDVIPATVIEQIVKVSADDRSYQFKALQLKEFITKSLAKRGELVTVVIRGASIVILTDAESGPYNSRMGRIGARRIRRSLARHSVVDLSKLTDEQRKEWDRDQIKLSLMATGLKNSRLPEVKPHKRIE